MTKILIGVTYYLPNISGLTIYAKILAEEMAKRGHKVTILSSQFKKDLKIKEKAGRIKIRRVAGVALGKAFLMPGYVGVARKLVKEADIVNAHLPSVEAFWLAFWAKIYKKKFVVTHHCEFWGGDWGNKIIGYLSFPVHLIVYTVAEKIVAASRDYAAHSIFLPRFKKKLVYIFPPIKVRENDKLGSRSSKKKVVGFVGRIAWEKGLLHLIKAMQQVEADLKLVGPVALGGEKTEAEIKEKSGDKIKMMGKLSDRKLACFYKQIDCLVLPSTNKLEAFGMVQAEAIRYGTPVVASNLPGVRVVVKSTRMGEIAKIGDSRDLAAKINLILKRGKKYYQKRSKNIELFDYRKTVEKYEEIFSN